jgi:hypothetical protein
MTARVSGRWGAGSLLVRPTRAHVQDRGVGLGRQGSSNKRCWCLRVGSVTAPRVVSQAKYVPRGA